MNLNELLAALTARPTVRRIVQYDDYTVLPLVQFDDADPYTIRNETNTISAILQSAGLPPSFGTYEEVGRASGYTTLWDRTAARLRPLADVNGVEGVFHVWSNEKVEVPVGFETRNDVFRGSKVVSGQVKYEERYLYPEGLYIILLSSQSTDTLEQTNALLEQIDHDGKIDLMYLTQEDMPEGSVRLV